MSNNGATNLWVLLGHGDGTFATHVDYATGYYPLTIAVADLNGDAKTDVIVGNSCTPCNTVSVLLGNGDGTLGPRTDIPVTSPAGIAIADVDGDTHADAIVSSLYVKTVTILLGRGDGTFEAPVGYPSGTGFVCVADLNGDARLDLAVADSYAYSVSVLLGAGDGTFGPEVDYGVGAFPRWVAVGDFSGDGRPDLAVPNSLSNTVSLLKNIGTGVLGVGPTRVPGTALALHVHPTPARGEVTVDFMLPRSGDAAVRVFDVRGRSIATLARGTLPAGTHTAQWNRRAQDGRVAPPGIYFVQVQSLGERLTKRAVLIR